MSRWWIYFNEKVMEVLRQRVRDQIVTPYRMIVQGLKSLVYWFPVIWRDRHWDYYYLFVLLRRKLQGIEVALHEGLLENGDQYAVHVHEALVILERLINDSHSAEFHQKHAEKWGEISLARELMDNGLSRVEFHRPGIVDEATAQQERTEFIAGFQAAGQAYDEDLTHFFGLLKEHVLEWWT